MEQTVAINLSGEQGSGKTTLIERIKAKQKELGIEFLESNGADQMIVIVKDKGTIDGNSIYGAAA